MPSKPKRKSRKPIPAPNAGQERDASTGKFACTADSPQTRWGRPGINGFAHWFKDIKPRVLTSRNSYEQICLTPLQKETLKSMLSVGEGGKILHSLNLLAWPRRHGKSTINALIVLWLFCSKRNFTIQLLGNNEEHSRLLQA
jgi:hypothetical protein